MRRPEADGSRRSQRDRLAKNAVAELATQGVGCPDIHLDVKKLRQGEAQAGLVEQARLGSEVDEEVDVTRLVVFTSSDGSEDARGRRVVLRDGAEDLLAVSEEAIIQGAHQRAPDALHDLRAGLASTILVCRDVGLRNACRVSELGLAHARRFPNRPDVHSDRIVAGVIGVDILRSQLWGAGYAGWRYRVRRCSAEDPDRGGQGECDARRGSRLLDGIGGQLMLELIGHFQR
jgi:hypothetical protein